MTAGTIALFVMLGITVLITMVSCLALLGFKRDVFTRMHYLAPVTTLAVPALLVAVIIQEGWGAATLKTVLIFFILLLVNAVLTHATARAARVRSRGHWVPAPEENVVGMPDQAQTELRRDSRIHQIRHAS